MRFGDERFGLENTDCRWTIQKLLLIFLPVEQTGAAIAIKDIDLDQFHNIVSDN